LEGHAQLIEFGWSYFAQLLNTIVLYLILRKILFKPVRSFMLNRQQGIADSITLAEQKNSDADKLKKQYEDRILGVEEEAREKIRLAVVKAETQSKEIVAEAQKKASDLLKKTADEIEREKIQAVSDFKDHIAELALYAAGKLIEKEMDSKEHHAIVGRIIEEAGTMKWQN
jgi:F-type H+-transporting ATPase subunit b